LIFKRYSNYFLPFGEHFSDEIVQDELYYPDSSIDMSYKFELITKNFISYTIFTFEYSSGAAHGLYGTTGYNYRLNPLAEFNLETLLNHNQQTLETLQKLCKQKLLKKAKEEYEIDNEKSFFLNEKPLKPEWQTFNNFYLKKDSIVIIFNIYQETAFALGQHEVKIKFDEILSQHDNLRTLKRVKQLMDE
jgi:hypothetical protein